jgi:DNA-3-methyladenine glycosylase I
LVGGAPLQPARRSRRSVPARTPLSDTLSKELRRRGFRFVGSTICYAFMQATGLVNDHLVACFRHQELGGAGAAARVSGCSQRDVSERSHR